jgi:hypothetical protein
MVAWDVQCALKLGLQLTYRKPQHHPLVNSITINQDLTYIRTEEREREKRREEKREERDDSHLHRSIHAQLLLAHSRSLDLHPGSPARPLSSLDNPATTQGAAPYMIAAR